jgi:hypothetical protein
MGAFDDLVGRLPIFGGGNLATLALYLLLAMGLVIVFGVIIFYLWKRKKWNLFVEFKIPRSDGRFVDAEWGKGSYNAVRGVVYVKRKGLKKSPMKPFDIKKYIQGKNILTVVQRGVNDYLPVMVDSWIEMQDDETGEEASLLESTTDMSESRAWRIGFERSAKSIYSITSLLDKYAVPISIGLIMVLWAIQFIIIYMKVT